VLERRKLVLLIVASVTMLSGCADVPALLRRHTYPPNFKYITREQLHSAMWQLADNVRALDAVMRQPGPINAARHAEVERLLLAMRDDTATPQAHGRPTNHPLISEHLKTFQSDVARLSRESRRYRRAITWSVPSPGPVCPAKPRTSPPCAIR
jgi:hypothetical protein